MDIHEFTKLCEQANASQEDKFSYRGHDVYLADGVVSNTDTDHTEQFRTIIAIGGNKRAKGKMDVMIPLYFEKQIIRNCNKEHRLNRARIDARFFVDALIDSENVGERSYN